MTKGKGSTRNDMVDCQGDPVLVLRDVDYDSPLNMNVLEKYLLLEAWLRCNGNIPDMAWEIKMSIKSVYRRITAHGLGQIFDSQYSAKAVRSEIDKLKNKYPLMFMSKGEFDKLFLS